MQGSVNLHSRRARCCPLGLPFIVVVDCAADSLVSSVNVHVPVLPAAQQRWASDLQDTERFQRDAALAQRKAEREAAREQERQAKEEAKLKLIQERAAKREAAEAEKEARRQARAALKGLSRACASPASLREAVPTHHQLLSTQQQTDGSRP